MVDAPIKLLPRHGFEQHLDDALPGLSAGFASGLESSLDDIFNSRNVICRDSCSMYLADKTDGQRNYRMHERRAVVHAADVSTAVKGAGDVDPGRAWRKKRPSNMVRYIHIIVNFEIHADPQLNYSTKSVVPCLS